MIGTEELAVDLAAALGEAGIAIHDCYGPGRPHGGCCLLPTAADTQYPAGVIVGWTSANTLSEGRPEGARWNTYEAVQNTMTEALWAILEAFGFPVVPFAQHRLPLVTGSRPAPQLKDRPWDTEDLAGNPDLQDRVPPMYGEPFYIEVIDVDGRLGRRCVRCGRPFALLHYPQAWEGSGVCCECWDGRMLVASDDHPSGEWVQLGRCNGRHLDEEGVER